jgi:hypothetical protein
MASERHVIDKVAILTKLREANEALGPLRQRLLELSVRDDRSWREIGDRLGMDAKTATRWTAAAINDLSAFLAGEPVPPPPMLRARVQPGAW